MQKCFFSFLSSLTLSLCLVSVDFLIIYFTSGSNESCGSDEAEDCVDGRGLDVLPALDGVGQEDEG